MNNSEIIVVEKTMCILMDNQSRLLASKGYDKVKNEVFYRLLGGSLNSGEDPEVGIRREIREELNSELDELESLAIVDNPFVYEGQSRRQTIYLFRGKLADKNIENKDTVHIVEEKYKFDAYWIPVKDVLEKKIILYPPFDQDKFLKC